jgi:2-methylcitrate dehydratase PrpD
MTNATNGSTPTPIPTSEQQLASFIVTAEVPPDVRRTARRYLLDWLGSTLAGGEMRPPSLLREVINELGGHSQATVIATGGRTSAPLAAFANAAASHVLEMDDLDPGSIYHPAAPTVAAALAVGEQLSVDGDTLLDAIAVGYEVGIRVGEALGPSHYEHWHTTGTAGAFGATAAAARLHGLDPEQTLQALGSAGTMTAGLWEFLADGAMSKQLHPAKAAHDGILATLVAQKGFTAATRILEGDKGVLAAMSSEPHPDRLTAALAPNMAEWRISGVAFKVHAACRHTHSAVDAALNLRQQHSITPDQIERVEVQIYSQALGLLDGVEPTTPYAAKFSLPFCIAVALTYGDLGPARFTETTIREQVTLDLVDRVSFETNPTFDALYPETWPSVVTITLRDGAVVTDRVDFPAGDIRAGVEDEDIAAKFARMTGEQLADEAAIVADRVLNAEPPLTASETVRALRMGGISLASSTARRG